jgi:hypothetical protein
LIERSVELKQEALPTQTTELESQSNPKYWWDQQFPYFK